MRPGLKARKGYIKQHSTADGTNGVLSMFQFAKGKRTERHLYAQMTDNDVLEATTAPPAVTTGAFGSEVFSGSSSSIPASWSVLNDELIFSNGVDQHQICAGTANYVQYFGVYDSDTRLPDIPTFGYDYTSEVSDANSTTVAVLDSLGNFVATSGTVVCTSGQTNFAGTNTHFLTELTVGQPVYVDAAEKNFIATITSDTVATVTTAWGSTHDTKSFTTSNDCLLICCPIMPNRVTFTIPLVNGNASTANVSYPISTGWKNLTITDGTIGTATKTLSQTGSMTWTQPTDAIPKYMFDKNGFWVKISFSSAVDSEVEVSSVTYGSGFTSIQNVWDGALQDAVEAQFYKNSNTTYYIYGTTSITLGGMTADDWLYFNSSDPIVGAFIDVAGTPNTTASTTINAFQYLAPSGSWTTVGTYTDGTTGLSKTGFVTFKRQTGICPQQFNGLGYGSYWYRFSVDKTLSASCNIGIMVMPYYEISDFGVGLCNSTWKDKTVYTFDQDPSYMYISAPDNPQVLSSINSAIFQAGDGRANKIVCMKPFYNELLICQEEKGASGGCITLLQGTKPEDLGKINLSNFYGAMNSQSMEVIETIEGGHNAFILSKRGIIVTDGKTVGFVPNFEKIRNYFDPSSSTSVRSGYESKMYLKYDSSYYVLKIGLVTGTSATENNTFLVYDILTKEFSTDTYANNFACECECDSASGNAPITQLAGGQADGFIYVLNNGDNDVSTAVDSFITIEFNSTGAIIRDEEMIIRVKTQTTGDMVMTPYYNGVEQTTITKTLSLKAEKTSDRIRRHRIPLNFKDQNVSVRLRHNTASESFYLLDYGIKLLEYSEQ
jgi:hypothetical protein